MVVVTTPIFEHLLCDIVLSHAKNCPNHWKYSQEQNH